MSYLLNAEELAWKIYRKRMIWIRQPVISVFKEETSRFGYIVLDFNELGEIDSDEIETFQVMISSEDDENDDSGLQVRNFMLLTEEAVSNFSNLIKQRLNRRSDN